MFNDNTLYYLIGGAICIIAILLLLIIIIIMLVLNVRKKHTKTTVEKEKIDFDRTLDLEKESADLPMGENAEQYYTYCEIENEITFMHADEIIV